MSLSIFSTNQNRVRKVITPRKQPDNGASDYALYSLSVNASAPTQVWRRSDVCHHVIDKADKGGYQRMRGTYLRSGSGIPTLSPRG